MAVCCVNFHIPSLISKVNFTNGNLKTEEEENEKIKFQYFKSVDSGPRRQQRRTLVSASLHGASAWSAVAIFLWAACQYIF